MKRVLISKKQDPAVHHTSRLTGQNCVLSKTAWPLASQTTDARLLANDLVHVANEGRANGGMTCCWSCVFTTRLPIRRDVLHGNIQATMTISRLHGSWHRALGESSPKSINAKTCVVIWLERLHDVAEANRCFAVRALTWAGLFTVQNHSVW